MLLCLTPKAHYLPDSYLLEQDFPGMRIGPEPTTDSFIAVMHGDTEGVVPGNALVVDPKKPFRKLNAFGNAFLNRWTHLFSNSARRPCFQSQRAESRKVCELDCRGAEKKEGERTGENPHQSSTFLYDWIFPPLTGRDFLF